MRTVDPVIAHDCSRSPRIPPWVFPPGRKYAPVEPPPPFFFQIESRTAEAPSGSSHGVIVPTIGAIHDSIRRVFIQSQAHAGTHTTRDSRCRRIMHALLRYSRSMAFLFLELYCPIRHETLDQKRLTISITALSPTAYDCEWEYRNISACPTS